MSATRVHDEAETYRRELVAYCYRYLGSYPEAEDAVQETMLRAWDRGDTHDGRASVRTWVYRVATNVCIDMRRAPQRRALPMDLHGPGTTPSDPSTLATRPPEQWIGPVPDGVLCADPDDPAERAAVRDSVRLAFLAALQLLPPRQRVVLLLRDVLAWSAQECAELLGTSPTAVESALARARRTVEASTSDAQAVVDAAEQELVDRYVAAFEAYDVDGMLAVLDDDACFSMPPYELWLRGTDEIERWWRGPGTVCVGSRTRRTRANAMPAVGVYHPVGPGRWKPFAVHVVDVVDGRVRALTHFMGQEVFTQLGLPDAVME